jgi:uncharacterized LabA/DUF88 family protein
VSTAGARKVALVVDYQNIHLVGHGLFYGDGKPKHETLIDPARFADQVLARRAADWREGPPPDDVLHSVYVYRGQPSNRVDPVAYGRNQAQMSQWTRDKRVIVQHRPLKYRDGLPHEKGIDVLVALKFVELAMSTVYDVVILCSHDSDLDPAIEHALRRGHRRVETAGWMGAYVPRGGKRLWHTALDASDFDACRDPRQY